MVECPICARLVSQARINEHIDSGCSSHLLADEADAASPATSGNAAKTASTQQRTPSSSVAGFFQRQSVPKSFDGKSQPAQQDTPSKGPTAAVEDSSVAAEPAGSTPASSKRPNPGDDAPSPKRTKISHGPIDVRPLAERMRPRTLDDVRGQPLVAKGGPLRALLESGRPPSMILYGSPGTGKTTIARLVAAACAQSGGPPARLVELHAAGSSVGECRRAFEHAARELMLTNRRTVIFCDEVHRFSRSQQDIFLAPVEAGTIVLVGATTENPSFRVVGGLLSRCRVFRLELLKVDDVSDLLKEAIAREVPEWAAAAASERTISDPSPATPQNQDSAATGDRLDAATQEPKKPPAALNSALLTHIATTAAGDARTALTLLETALSLLKHDPDMAESKLMSTLTSTLIHDRAGSSHYAVISALHKSIRGSQPHAALYYLARALSAGEDPLFIARRLLVAASEDVGLADATALPLVSAVQSAVQTLGMPEARIPLAHATVHLALAPKSVRAYRGLAAAEAAVNAPGAGGAPRVPPHLINGSTALMRDIEGAGVGYKYNPDYVEGRVAQEYMPEGLEGREFLPMLDLGSTVDNDLPEAELAALMAGGEVTRGNEEQQRSPVDVPVPRTVPEKGPVTMMPERRAAASPVLKALMKNAASGDAAKREDTEGMDGDGGEVEGGERTKDDIELDEWES